MEYRYLSIWEETGNVDDRLITVTVLFLILKTFADSPTKPQEDAFKAKGKLHA